MHKQHIYVINTTASDVAIALHTLHYIHLYNRPSPLVFTLIMYGQINEQLFR